MRARPATAAALDAYLLERRDRQRSQQAASGTQQETQQQTQQRGALSEESFFKSFWVRENRRSEPALAAVEEFLLLEPMRNEMAERHLSADVLRWMVARGLLDEIIEREGAPPPVDTGTSAAHCSSGGGGSSGAVWEAWRRRVVRRLLDSPLQQAVRTVRQKQPGLHRGSREFAEAAMREARATLRRRIRAAQELQQRQQQQPLPPQQQPQAEPDDGVVVERVVSREERDAALRREAISLLDSDDDDDTDGGTGGHVEDGGGGKRQKTSQARSEPPRPDASSASATVRGAD